MEVCIAFSDNPTTKKRLRIEKKLSTSRFDVFQVYCPSRRSRYALKIFPKNVYGETYYQNEKLMFHLSHPNVIQNIPVISHDERFYSIVTELADNGDFYKLVIQGVLDSDILIRTYFRQLIEGIEYIHSSGVAHLDLKLENLMLGSDFKLKIIDFDHAQPIADKEVLSKGTAGYRAPEVLDKTCRNLPAADIFSAGVILFALSTKALPFREVEDINCKRLLFYSTFVKNNSKFWENKAEAKHIRDNDALKELVNGMLQEKIEERWTIHNIKNSQWYKGPVYDSDTLKKVMKEKLEDIRIFERDLLLAAESPKSKKNLCIQNNKAIFIEDNEGPICNKRVQDQKLRILTGRRSYDMYRKLGLDYKKLS